MIPFKTAKDAGSGPIHEPNPTGWPASSVFITTLTKLGTAAGKSKGRRKKTGFRTPAVAKSALDVLECGLHDYRRIGK
jgi:hypothetical protein